MLLRVNFNNIKNFTLIRIRKLESTYFCEKKILSEKSISCTANTISDPTTPLYLYWYRIAKQTMGIKLSWSSVKHKNLLHSVCKDETMYSRFKREIYFKITQKGHGKEKSKSNTSWSGVDDNVEFWKSGPCPGTGIPTDSNSDTTLWYLL